MTYDATPPPDTRRRGWRPRLGGAQAVALSILLALAFAFELLTGGPGRWGLSALAIRRGHVEALFTHMLSHGGFLHLFMNLTALWSFSAVVAPRLGAGLRQWVAYGGLFLASGLAGGLAFLALDPTGSTPMVGASGAICGLWGAASRIVPWEPDLLPLRAPSVRRNALNFAVSNLVLFAIIFGLASLSGGGGGLAWQAHLGGYLFGLLAAPWFVQTLPAALQPVWAPGPWGPWGPRG